jgi:broad specificity phosphatase PhoE
MSLLTLVRHGQATAFQQVSDRLSELGEAQARQLALFWLKNGTGFDNVYTGTLVRQTATEQIVARCFGDDEVTWPAATALPGFNEYDATGVLSHLVPAMAARDKRFAELASAFEASRHGPDRNRTFQRMFQMAMHVWLSGELTMDGVEPWPAFRDRVRAAFGEIMRGPANRRVAVFTSGGPIGLAVQLAMQSPDAMFLELNWRIRNCSLTEFVFSGERITLDSFNGVPHLADTALWTYR